MKRKKDRQAAPRRPATASAAETPAGKPGDTQKPPAAAADSAVATIGKTASAAPGDAQKPPADEVADAAAYLPDAPDTPGMQAAPTVDALLEQVADLKRQAQERRDQALRAGAELENTRKRALRDIEHAHKYALEKFARELLPVLDSMRLGVDAAAAGTDGAAAENLDSLREGMSLTLKMFTDCLQKFGVTAHNPVGERFDPQWHEAVSMREQEGADSGRVISVMQQGYALNGRLLRPAMVVVAK